MSGEPIILLVEDNEDDAELTMMALKEARLTNRVVHVIDGLKALDYLWGEGEYAGRDVTERPAVVLLDVNLPRRSGIEVLQSIRSDPRSAHVPVVILTSSNEDRDRLAAYRHFANSYVRKPVDYDQFVAATRHLGLYWLVLNLPSPAASGAPGRG